MKTKLLKYRVFLAGVFLVAQTATAALVDRGGGMIYDTDANLTWLKDWNHARASGWDEDGLMTWDKAVVWADQLELGGYKDWRLPSALDTDGSLASLGRASEFGHLWYLELENISLSINTGPFESMSSSGATYWTGTSLHPLIAISFGAYTLSGFTDSAKSSEYRAVAVRVGDVIPVPEPQTHLLMLVGLGAAGMLASRRWR